MQQANVEHAVDAPPSLWTDEQERIADILARVRALQASVSSDTIAAESTGPGHHMSDHALDGDAIANAAQESAEDSGNEPLDADRGSDQPADPPATFNEPMVLARLRAVDPSTGDCFTYEIIDADDQPFDHPWFVVSGHELTLRPGLNLADVPAGPQDLRLRVVDAAENASLETLRIDVQAWIAQQVGA